MFLAVAAGSDDLHLGELALEVALGLVVGVVIPVAAILLERTRFFAASTAYEPLNGLAIGLLVLAVAQVTHANLFLAAFAAGITVATFGPRQRAAFEHFGENIAELFKLAALLVFGALISLEFLGDISWAGWVFAVLAIFVARPVALWLSFLRSGLDMREQAAAMWFGPKGFASVVYGLLVLESGIPAADEIFHLVALTIVISIVLHSSTDVVVARAFDEEGRNAGLARRPAAAGPGCSAPVTGCCGEWPVRDPRGRRPYGGRVGDDTIEEAGMRAGDVSIQMSTVAEDTPAREAARVLAAQDLPGLIVVDAKGRPLTVLAGTQVLRMALPSYCQDDPALARVIDEAAADVILEGIGDRTVADLLPRNRPELPAVSADATMLEVAAVMARSNVPLVAVVDKDRVMTGAITLDGLLDRMLGT